MFIGYLVISYVLGSIPLAWFLGIVVNGTDIRKTGSGNAGVLNVALQVARWVGLVTFLGEIGKGVLVVLLARTWNLDGGMTSLVILTAVIATRWSIWIYGGGGRGNTLGVAALTLLSWQFIAISLGIWVLARLILRSSFRATRIWIISLPVILGLVLPPWPYAFLGAALGAIYLTSHKVNTDDHALLQSQWPSLWAFLTSPRRGRNVPGQNPEPQKIERSPFPEERGDQ